jgi:hypothetical protein
MSQYYKLNDKTDAVDVKMIASLVGMGVLEPAGHSGEPTDAVLRDMAAFTWVFRKSDKYDLGSTLHVSGGNVEGEAECANLPPGYYHIISANR